MLRTETQRRRDERLDLSKRDDAGVLGPVKGSRAKRGGKAALDKACARRRASKLDDGQTDASGGDSGRQMSARRKKKKKVVDLSSAGFPADSPTRSETQIGKGPEERSTMRNVALDLAARKIAFCEVREGHVVERRTVGSLDTLDDLLGERCPPARVVIESCREAWHLHAVLTKRGHEVVVVDTTRVKQLGIGQHGRKTDRIDAEILARALERGHIPVAHVLSPQRQILRLELGIRKALVETRSQYITTVRALVRAHGERLPTCDANRFLRRAREARLSDTTRTLVEPLLCLIGAVEEQQLAVEQRIDRLCAKEPIVQQLTTVPGVGTIVAAAFVSVIDDAHRFRHAHQVGSYLGLVPNEDSSGDRRRLGAITKRGNTYMRFLLVQAAWALSRCRNVDDPLRRWALSLAERRGKRIAMVALARRLAGLLWAMWRDGTVYDAQAVAHASAKGFRRQAQSRQVLAAALERAASKAADRQTIMKTIAQNLPSITHL
jgi:transposase